MPSIRLLAFLLSLAILSSAARAATADDPEIFTRQVRHHVDYTVHEDGSFVEAREVAIKVLNEKAIRSVKQTSITYSTSIQTAEVREAYTLKADGRRIEVPPANFQVEANSGRNGDQPVISDLTTTTVVFPDVEVGDTLVFAYRLTALQPIFPGHFSTRESFRRTVAYDDVRVRMDVPAGLWTQHRSREMQEKIGGDNGRRIIEWTFANPQPRRSTRYDFSVYDIEADPGFEFSTFRSHGDIARAYGARATPKAAVTPRLRDLAEQIARGEDSPREVARALYDWVATNITYAGNCIGLGSVVPRDTDFILDNRMGDCKDHATLLQALLAAKGIASTQALVNSGSAYRLPGVPLVAMVNHVITYLPDLDLYLDSTSSHTPFGLLPFADSDKPVLLVDGHRDGLKTPAIGIGTNRQTMKTQVTILPDGSARGEVEVRQHGMYAVETRARFRRMKKEVQDDLVKNMFKNMGYVGSGSVEAEDPKALRDSYRYKARFEVEHLYQFPGTGAFAIAPHFYSDAPISAYVSGALRHDDEAAEWACTSGKTVEEYTYVLPKTMKVLALPDDVKISNDFLSYEASYRRKGSTLLVRRTLDDRTRGHVCTSRVAEAYRSFAARVLANLKAQVVYR